LRSYVELIKPRLTSLLVFSSLTLMLLAFRYAAAGFRLDLLFFGLVAIAAGCGGCNAVTCYLDRDIDALMLRTKKRPIPSGRVKPPEKALGFGVGLIVFSLILAYLLGFFPFLFLTLGVFNNTVIYSLLLKRRTKLNIIGGSPSGAFAALFGWSVVADNITLLPVLASILVVLWIPTHIWSFAYYRREDYLEAKVPMLSAFTSDEKAVKILLLCVIVIFAYAAVVIPVFALFGWVYIVFSLASGVVALIGGLRLYRSRSAEDARLMFKLSSPYLLLLFLGMILDVYL